MNAAKAAFAEFLNDANLDSRQIYFVRMHWRPDGGRFPFCTIHSDSFTIFRESYEKTFISDRNMAIKEA